MATKFYLLSKDTQLDYFNGGASWPNHNWSAWSSYAYYGKLIDTVKEGEPSIVLTVDSSVSVVNNLLYRGISRKLQPQTISGTFDAILGVGQNVPDMNCYTRLFVYIGDTTGSPFTPVVKSYLINNYQDSIEWPDFAGRPAGSIRLAAPIAISPYTIPNDGRDYRIFIDFGCAKTGSIGGGTRARFGARGTDYTQLPDMTVATGDNIRAPYIEFSADITLKPSANNTNDEPERAIDMGASSVTVNPIGDVLSEHYQWYKYTQNNTVDRVVSALFCSPGTPGDNYSDLYVYAELNTGITGPPFFIGASAVSSGGKRPIMMPLIANGDLYLKTYLSGFGPNTGTLSVVEGPANPVQPGDLLDTSDNGSPSIYDPTIPGGVSPSIWYTSTGQIRYVSGKHASSEIGVSLGNGKFTIVDQIHNRLIIYDKAPSLAELIRVQLPDSITSIGTDFSFFYPLVTEGSNTRVFKISDTGIINTKTWLIPGSFPGGGIHSSGVSRDGKILYYENNFIAKYDLENDTPLTGFDSDYPSDMIVLKDNTLVAVMDQTILHYSPSGTILHTYAIPPGTGGIDHIVHEFDDSIDRIWVWLHSNGMGVVQLIQFTTGTILKTFSFPMFSTSGVGYYSSDCNPVRFGGGSSCPMLMMMTPKVFNYSGVYQVKRGKTDDTVYTVVSVSETDNVKIPDPFIKTSLIGS